MAPNDILNNLGPLAQLAGVWEGNKGADQAPSDNRGTEHNQFKERITFEPFGPVNNHEQTLYGLRYTTKAWPLGQEEPFHEEYGYWLWDAKAEQVLRCFMVPRGVTVLAGGTVKANAKEFNLSAEAGSCTYGICSNKFLDIEFKTIRYELKVTIHDANCFSYFEDTQILMKGRKEVFHHTDSNHLERISN